MTEVAGTVAEIDVPAQRRSLDLPVLVRRTRALLDAGVPLTLLLDLGDEGGPRSQARYRSERPRAR